MHQKETRNNLIVSISEFVTELFKERLPDWAIYHNLWHTIETVKGCEEIGIGSGLLKEDLEILNVAAWFHDTGYIFQANGHEEKSAEIAYKFLKEKNYQENKINEIIACIVATKISNQPNNLLESVICDADLISLAKPDYLEKNNLLKSETELRENIKLSELEWLKRSLNFLSTHQYYTDHAQKNYDHQLKANIRNLEMLINKHR